MPAFNLKPTVCAFLGEAYAFGILENPTIPNAMLNWNIQWAFPATKPYELRAQFILYPRLNWSRYAKLGLLKVTDFREDLSGLLRKTSLVATIVDLLKSGNYAYMYVDYFHIQGTAQFGRMHVRHDLLIYDYCPTGHYFKAAIYTKRRVFGSVDVPTDSLVAAFTSSAARGPDSLPRCRGDRLLGIQAVGDSAHSRKLDLPSIKIQLECFRNSTDLDHRLRGTRLISRFCQTDARRVDRPVFGLDVYERVREYYTLMINEGCIWFDQRIARLIWEHKKLMRIRLQRIALEGQRLDESLLAEWRRIEDLAHMTHFQSFAARTKRDFEFLRQAGNGLREMESLERSFLPRLLKAI